VVSWAHKGKIFLTELLPYPAVLRNCLFDQLENIEASCRVVMGDAMMQQNTADRSRNDDSASVPTSTVGVPFLLIGEAAFLSPLLKRHLDWWM